jgi:hypothetical protein
MSRSSDESATAGSSAGAAGRFGASQTAPTTTQANAATRMTPKTPPGSGSWKRVIAAAIGIAFVASVAMPAVVSALPRWKPDCNTIVPAA